MIIEALCNCYDRFEKNPAFNISRYGYSNEQIYASITLTENGEIIHPIVKFDKGTKLVVPSIPIRSSGIKPAFVFDNSQYFFGHSIQKDNKNKKMKGKDGKYLVKDNKEHFKQCKELHEKIFSSVENSEEVRALLSFFENAQEKYFDLTDDEKNLISNKFVFRLKGKEEYFHDNIVIKKAWEEYFNGLNEKNDEEMECLDSGNKQYFELLHQDVKGLAASGIKVVSFNEKAFESFYKKNGEISPISKLSAFKYVVALNFLVQDKKHILRIGNDKILFWAEKEAKNEENLLNFLFGNKDESEEKKSDELTSQMIKSFFSQVYSGKEFSSTFEIDESITFYILGITNNSSRAVIRYYYQNSLGQILDHISEHYRDIDIIKKDDDTKIVSPWRILINTAVGGETSNIPPLLESSLIRSILEGIPYSYNLYTAILNRIRSEQKIDFVRVGILKSYLNRISRQNNKSQKEMITMTLNKEETNQGYLLGRLLAVLEKGQRDALGDVNASILDKYLNSCITTPQTVFPTLLMLFQKHLSKSGKYYTNQIANEIIAHFDSTGFPQILDVEDQGRFLIGYYHQNMDLWTKNKNSEEK